MLIFIFRFPLMRLAGNYLIKEDNPIRSDAAFVLSGSSLERAEASARLYKQAIIPTIVVTGKNENDNLKIYQINIPDAQITQKALINAGVDSSAIQTLPLGTSTYEEAQAILGYAKQRNYKRIIVVSSKFHTRRIYRLFYEKFQKEGIEVLVYGADPITYKIEDWWNYEDGLIFVNNEYVKLLYYAMKYN